MSTLLSRLFGGGATQVSVDELAGLIADRSRPTIVDVREPHEFKYGHIRGARTSRSARSRPAPRRTCEPVPPST